MIINPYVYAAASSCTDADGQAFINAAGITDSTQQSAVCQLVKDLKSANIWTKMKAIYPIVGGSASSHKYNLKDPRDLDAAFRLSFATGWTHSSTGMTPNGTSAYADTWLNSSTSLILNNTHISYYSRTNVDLQQIEIGCTDGTNQFLLATRYLAVGSISDQYRIASRISTVQTDSRGLFVGTRTSSIVHKLFKNGSQIGTTNTGVAGSLINFKFVLGATNNSNIVTLFSTKQCAFASIGDGLTDTEVSLLYQITEKYQVTLGRNINPTQSFYYNGAYDNDTNVFLFKAQITDTTQQTAVNTLVTDLKGYNIWTKMKAIYPIVGGTASSHKWNLKDPRDLDAAFRLTFSTGWTHSSNGMTPNGTSAYSDTFLIPLSNLTNNNSHISVYLRTNTDNNGVDIGIQDDMGAGTTQSAYYIITRTSNTLVGTIQTDDANRISGSNTDSRGFYITSRTTSTSLKQYKNSSIFGTNTNTSTGTRARYSIPLGAYRYINDAGSNTYSSYSTREQAFASIGDGLTDAEASNLYTAVQNYNTTLGRQV